MENKRSNFLNYFCLVIASVAISACNNGGSGGSSNSQDGTTTVTVASDCVANNNCQGNVYNNANGFYNYPTQQVFIPSNNGYGYGQVQYIGNTPIYVNNNNSYLCNCPAGTMPTYNPYGGLGCVQTQMLPYNASAYMYFSWGYANNGWVNIPQISNMSGYNNSTCYNGAVRSCVVGQLDSCGPGTGYSCQPTQAASAIGLCMNSNYVRPGYYNGGGYPGGPIHR